MTVKLFISLLHDNQFVYKVNKKLELSILHHAYLTNEKNTVNNQIDIIPKN